MQELVGRLTALDPEASETLKVVAYFDVLTAGGVGLEALVRGAAVLSGTVAGAFDGRRTHRVGPAGDRLPGGAGVTLEPRWPVRPVATGAGSGTGPGTGSGIGRVWLERDGRPHANDEMVVERLALAVDLVAARRGGGTGGALDVALDAGRDVAERRVALARLRLDGARDLRVAALPLASDPGGAPATVTATPHGLVRAVVLRRGATVPGPAGLGVAGAGEDLPESLRTALLALRLVPDDDGPHRSRDAAVVEPAVVEPAVVDAAELGVVLAAVGALEPVAARQPDVVALARLDARGRAVLDELTRAESVRGAAAALGMHHSTLQARHDALTAELGYDPRTLDGRARYRLARLLLRLTEDRATGRAAG